MFTTLPNDDESRNYKRRKQLKPSKCAKTSDSENSPKDNPEKDIEQSKDSSPKISQKKTQLMLLNNLIASTTQPKPCNSLCTNFQAQNLRENPMEFLAQHFLANLNQILNQKSFGESTPKTLQTLDNDLNQSGCSVDLSLPTSNSSLSETSLNLDSTKRSEEKMTNDFGKRISSLDESSNDQGSESDRKKIRDEIKIQPYMTSNGVELFSCPLCSETNIEDRAKLTQHLQLHQSDQRRDDGKHVCCFCFNELSSNSSLERHLLTHTNHRPFQCTFCDKAFTTNGNLSRHIKTSHQMVKSESLELSKGNVEDDNNPSLAQSRVEESPIKIASRQTPSINFQPLNSQPAVIQTPSPIDPILAKPSVMPIFQPIPINNFLLNALSMINQSNQNFNPINLSPMQLFPATMIRQQQPTGLNFNTPVVMHSKMSEQKPDLPIPLTVQKPSIPECRSNLNVSKRKSAKSRRRPLNRSIFYRFFRCGNCKISCLKRSQKFTQYFHKCKLSQKRREDEDVEPLNPGTFGSILDLSKNASQFNAKSLFNKKNLFSGLSDSEKACSVSSEENHQVKKKNSYKDAPRLISCPINGCKQKFPWNSSLKRHILTHTPHKPFACTRCNKSFSTKSNRERHMERVHKVSLKRQKKKTEELERKASAELTGEELISMDSNDKQAEDISNKLLQTAGYPKVEPNPGRFLKNRPNDNETNKAKQQFLLPETQLTNVDVQSCSFCNVKIMGKANLLTHIMSSHLAKL